MDELYKYLYYKQYGKRMVNGSYANMQGAKLDGIREKRQMFMPINDFEDVFTELLEDNCSYVVGIEPIWEAGYIPTYIPVILKDKNPTSKFKAKDKWQIGLKADECGSRILNYFDCPTTYDKVVEVDDKEYVASVNFLSMLDNYTSIYELMGNEYLEKKSLKENIEDLKKLFTEKDEDVGYSKRFIESARNFIQDYAYAYLVNKYVLCNTDYEFNNVGIVGNDLNNGFKMSPSFDLEYTFDLQFEEDGEKWGQSAKDDILYVYSSMPKVYNKFKHFTRNFTKFKSNGADYVKLIRDVLGNDENVDELLVYYSDRVEYVANIVAEIMDREMI